MAGIYIHIPFCKQACYYCNFHFSTSLKYRDRMVRCLLRALEWHASPANAEVCGMVLPHDTAIETIYFGGGTPSILTPGEICSFLNLARSIYHVDPQAEITLEANPDDISATKLSGWKAAGINRLSIGVQSFIERDLRWMNRAHNAGQAIESLELAMRSGFQNLSADLIFGTPGLSDEEWLQNIRTLTSLNVPHIAAYALTVEPKTALHKMIGLKKKEDVSNEQQARQFELLMEAMTRAGYEHYEISNFARPSFRSRHNSSYWQQRPYLGIGPSAHSFDGARRYWNVANNIIYMNAVESGTPFFEMETLTPTQKLNEYIMTSLRTSEGLDLMYLSKVFSEDEAAAIKKKTGAFAAEWIDVSDRFVRLTDAGKLFADKISAELFF